MIKLDKHILIIGMISLIGGYFIPTEYFTSQDIKYITGFMSFYSAGIFPSITLLINSLSINNESQVTFNNSKNNISESIDSLFLIFFSSVIFIFCIFLATKFQNIPYLSHLSCSFSLCAFIIATYGTIWLPKKIKSILEEKYQKMSKELQKNYRPGEK